MAGPMGERAWCSKLTELIMQEDNARGVVVIGLGHPLKGDDYVGSLVAKDLRRRIKRGSNIRIVDAEDSPENVLNVLQELRPGLVVLVDSLEAGLEPGSISLMDLSETTYPFFGTHSIPLKVLLQAVPEISKIVLLGIEPASYDIGVPLSKEAANAEAEVVLELGNILEKMRGR
jgi:hydrogenase 3 maturation protease